MQVILCCSMFTPAVLGLLILRLHWLGIGVGSRSKPVVLVKQGVSDSNPFASAYPL